METNDQKHDQQKPVAETTAKSPESGYNQQELYKNYEQATQTGGPQITHHPDQKCLKIVQGLRIWQSVWEKGKSSNAMRQEK